MEHDTPEWQRARDKRLHEWVGDPVAVEALIDISDACELFDDLIDRDKPIDDDHVVRVLFNLLTELPLNPFWERNKTVLIPVLIAGINAWLDANDLERGTDNEKAMAYMLRIWYVEIVTLVIYLTRGRDYMRAVSLDVRRFFCAHETLEQYKESLE